MGLIQLIFLNILASIAGIWATNYVLILAHELGHILGGVLCGGKAKFIRVGSGPVWSMTVCKVRVRLGLFPFGGTSRGTTFRSEEPLFYMFVKLGGPLGGLVAALIGLNLIIFFVPTAFSSFWLVGVGTALQIAIVTNLLVLIPAHQGWDGYWISFFLWEKLSTKPLPAPIRLAVAFCSFLATVVISYRACHAWSTYLVNPAAMTLWYIAIGTSVFTVLRSWSSWEIESETG